MDTTLRLGDGTASAGVSSYRGPSEDASPRPLWSSEMPTSPAMSRGLNRTTTQWTAMSAAARPNTTSMESFIKDKDDVSEKHKRQGVLQGMISGSLRKKLEVLNKQVTALDTAVVGLQKAFETMANTLDEHQPQVTEDLNSLNMSMSFHQTVSNQRLDDLQSAVASTKAMFAELDTTNKRMSKQHDSFAASLRERMNKFEQEFTNMTTANENCFAAMEKRMEMVEQSQAVDVASLRSSLESATAHMPDWSSVARKADVDGEVGQLRRQLETQQSSMVLVESQLEGICALSGVTKQQLAEFAGEAGKKDAAPPPPKDEGEKKSKNGKVKKKEQRGRSEESGEGAAGSSSNENSASNRLTFLARLRQEDEEGSSDEEIPETLQTQVEVITRAMVEKADADDVAVLRGLIAGMQGRLNDQERSLAEKLNQQEVTQVRDGIDGRMQEYTNKLDEIRHEITKFASPEDLRRLNDSTTRLNRQINTLQDHVKEKISHKQLQPLVDAVKMIKSQITSVREDVSSKADRDALISNLTKLQDVQAKLASFAGSVGSPPTEDPASARRNSKESKEPRKTSRQQGEDKRASTKKKEK